MTWTDARGATVAQSDRRGRTVDSCGAPGARAVLRLAPAGRAARPVGGDGQEDGVRRRTVRQ